MTSREQYIRDQRKWIKLNKLKVGDRVKVIAKATDLQSGWGAEWVTDMQVGHEGDVISLEHPGILGAGIAVSAETGLASGVGAVPAWWFPFFCLVKINE